VAWYAQGLQLGFQGSPYSHIPASSRADQSRVEGYRKAYRKLSLGSAPSELGPQSIDERLFAAVTSDQRQIDVDRKAWIAPTRHRDSPDKAIPPPTLSADCSHFSGGRENVDHSRHPGSMRLNNDCCSTRPDLSVSRAGFVTAAREASNSSSENGAMLPQRGPRRASTLGTAASTFATRDRLKPTAFASWACARSLPALSHGSRKFDSEIDEAHAECGPMVASAILM
jgi:hypothetical protein